MANFRSQKGSPNHPKSGPKPNKIVVVFAAFFCSRFCPNLAPFWLHFGTPGPPRSTFFRPLYLVRFFQGPQELPGPLFYHFLGPRTSFLDPFWRRFGPPGFRLPTRSTHQGLPTKTDPCPPSPHSPIHTLGLPSSGSSPKAPTASSFL